MKHRTRRLGLGLQRRNQPFTYLLVSVLVLHVKKRIRSEVKIDRSKGRVPNLYNESFRYVQHFAAKIVPVSHLEWIVQLYINDSSCPRAYNHFDQLSLHLNNVPPYD